jgi:hypothetical protein
LGLLEYKRMPFKLRSQFPETNGLRCRGGGSGGSLTFDDDSLVASKDPVTHGRDLQQLLGCLTQGLVVINTKKWGGKGSAGVSFPWLLESDFDLASWRRGISFLTPLKVKALQALLGKVNFHWIFLPLPGIAQTFLTDALCGGSKGYGGDYMDRAYGGDLYSSQAGAA